MTVFLLSGIGSGIFSFSAAWQRGLMGVAALILGVISGAALVPALLPWIPGKSFALKGSITGLMTGFLILLFGFQATGWEWFALFLFTVSASSFLAMNFTGSTPYTSPSGVEKEMRRFIPLQAASVVLAAAAWIGAGFSG